MPSQYFNGSRFARLLRQQIQTQVGGYALQAVVLAAAMLVVLGGLTYLQQSPPPATVQVVFMMLFLLGAGSYFASTVLAGYGQGSRAALALLLPASQAEKFLVAWLLSGPVFLAVFLAEFYLVDWLVVSTSHPAGVLYNVFAESRSCLEMLQNFVLAQSLGLWGSIFFRRQQFVRTAFVVFSTTALLTFLNLRALKALVSHGVQFTTPFGNPRLEDFGGLQLRLPDTALPWLAWVPLALAALLWVAAYARLTEKQL